MAAKTIAYAQKSVLICGLCGRDKGSALSVCLCVHEREREVAPDRGRDRDNSCINVSEQDLVSGMERFNLLLILSHSSDHRGVEVVSNNPYTIIMFQFVQ